MNESGDGCFGSLARVMDRRQEAVAVTRNGFDVARVLGGIAQRGPQLGHGFVQAAVKINEGVHRPELVAKLFPSHHFAGVIEQEAQDLEGLFLQLDSNAALA